MNENNGHDHDDYGFHYHLTIDSSALPTFPATFGPKFYGCISDTCNSELCINMGQTCTTTTSTCGTSTGVPASEAQCLIDTMPKDDIFNFDKMADIFSQVVKKAQEIKANSGAYYDTAKTLFGSIISEVSKLGANAINNQQSEVTGNDSQRRPVLSSGVEPLPETEVRSIISTIGISCLDDLCLVSMNMDNLIPQNVIYKFTILT